MIRHLARALWTKATKLPDEALKEFAWDEHRSILSALGRDTTEDLKALQRLSANTGDADEIHALTAALILPPPAVSAEQLHALAIPLYRVKAESSPEYVAWAKTSTARWLRAVGLTVEHEGED